MMPRNSTIAPNTATASTNSQHNTDASERSDMAPKVGRKRYSRNPAVRFRGNSVYVLAASDGRGVTANTLAKTTPEYVGRIAHLIDAAAAKGDFEFIEHTLAPIDGARQRIVAPALTSELIQRVQATDMAEEIAETRYLTTPTKAALVAWLHAAEKQRADTLLLVLALRAEVGRW